MRSNECRVIVYDTQSRSVGCGFIVDSRHIMTCLHVVHSAAGTTKTDQNTRVAIKTDRGEQLVVKAVKWDNAVDPSGLDICVLERTDGGSFAPTVSALWARGRPDQRFTGLGLTANHPQGVSLSGELGAYQMGGRAQIINSANLDTRVEQGCSGAPIFGVSTHDVLSDAPLLGMVTRLQQQSSGVVIGAETLAAFWPHLRPFDARADEALPDMFAGQVESSVVDRLVTEIDRTPQRRKFQAGVGSGEDLRNCGYLITQLSGIWDDLPERCARSLGRHAIGILTKTTAPDTVKLNILTVTMWDLLCDGERKAGLNLLSVLQTHYATASDIGSIRARIAADTVPLVIFVAATPAELQQVTPKALTGLGKCLAELTRPGAGKAATSDTGKSILMFIITMRDDGAALLAAGTRAPIVKKPWFIDLPELEPILPRDLRTWALQLADDPAARRLRVQIDTMLDARGANGAAFRLKDIESWLSVG